MPWELVRSETQEETRGYSFVYRQGEEEYNFCIFEVGDRVTVQVFRRQAPDPDYHRTDSFPAELRKHLARLLIKAEKAHLGGVFEEGSVQQDRVEKAVERAISRGHPLGAYEVVEGTGSRLVLPTDPDWVEENYLTSRRMRSISDPVYLMTIYEQSWRSGLALGYQEFQDPTGRTSSELVTAAILRVLRKRRALQ
jgi:hypothetical protein